jgi:hypothetical protein
MTPAAITAYLGQPLDIHGVYAPEITFNEIAIINGIPDFRELFITKVLHTDIGVDLAFLENLVGKAPADPVDIA